MLEYNRRNIRTWSMLGSRRLFGIVLEELAEQDDKFVFVTADVGRYYAINRFVEKYPDRIVNVGIAEQNMIGVAAGLAKEGFHPMVATYATFATARVLDQIRVSMGLMKLGITVVGVSAGLAEGEMSATHMGLEDIADVMPIPNIRILSPADCMETVKCMVAAVKSEEPTYIRLTGQANAPIVYKEDYCYEIGKSVVLREGKKFAIIATGVMVAHAIQVAERLEQELGLNVEVINVHTIKPVDPTLLYRLHEFEKVVTIEEHSIYGGLGSILASAMAMEVNRALQLTIGVQDFYPAAAEYKELLEICDLSIDKIYRKVSVFFQGEYGV